MNTITLKKFNRLLITLCFLPLLFGCTEVLNFDKTTALSGQIISRDEFGIENNDAANVSVKLDKTDFTTLTNEAGFFTFKDISTGSYDLVITKESYGNRIIRSINVYTGKDTLALGKIDLLQPSSIEIQDLSIEIEGNLLFARGKITHQFPMVAEEGSFMRNPKILVCFNDQSNVSDRNNIGYGIIEVPVPSNTEFKVRLYGIYPPYYRDKPFYYVAYGKSVYNYLLDDRIYNIETGYADSYSTLLGKSSNVFSMVGEN